MDANSGLVIGTAGHIDHGKTSLVYALTGVDTDRLAEEKRRGISIDLGFAHCVLPDGSCLSFVDVPGHERFVRNMLAGAGGIEAVLLVVAANESVKPQTREHFEICRLLGVARGLIALTKADLATAEQLAHTSRAVEALCRGSFLSGAPIIPVSSKTGEGLSELKAQLSMLATEASHAGRRDPMALARLPIDRSFALKGFGTVVTGTLVGGTLRNGDTVEVLPQRQEARIRGLQVHGKQVSLAVAGERTAVNLAGIEHSQISRGAVLAHPGTFETTGTIDVSVDWLAPSQIAASRRQVFFHIGTSEAIATLKPIAGQTRLARLLLSEPVLACPGDRFVLRQPSPAITIAGGMVIEAFPIKRLNRRKTLERLAALQDADLVARLRILIQERPPGQRVETLARVTGLAIARVRDTLRADPQFVLDAAGQVVVSRDWIREQREKLLQWLANFHKSNPAAGGAPVSQARMGLDAGLVAFLLEGFAAIRVQGDLISLETHRARVSPEESQILSRMESAFRQAGYQPPAAGEILKSAAADPKQARSLLEALIKNGRLVRVSAELVFHADVIAHIRKSLAAHQGRRFSVPEFKAWTNVSRKYAIPLLEYLDHQRITRRDGDSRVVL
jgi:selenocysteine-specific elongation factor